MRKTVELSHEPQGSWADEFGARVFLRPLAGVEIMEAIQGALEWLKANGETNVWMVFNGTPFVVSTDPALTAARLWSTARAHQQGKAWPFGGPW